MAPWRLGHAGGSSAHLHVPWLPLVEPAATSVPTVAVASRMAFDELGAPRERGHHLGTVEYTDWCTLQVRMGAPIDMLGPGRAVRGRERCTRSQKSWFHGLPNVL